MVPGHLSAVASLGISTGLGTKEGLRMGKLPHYSLPQPRAVGNIIAVNLPLCSETVPASLSPFLISLQLNTQAQ